MKHMTKKCPVCHKEFNYIDLRHVPKTCGSRVCETNYKYRERTRNLQTGEYQSFDKINHV